MSKFRLPPRPGERIDRTKPVSFTFERKRYEGFDGDTIASALAAAGRRVLSRSFKYRRPRGILTMAGQDANTLVQLPDEPNALADIHKITEGLAVTAQNFDISLDRDAGAAMGLFSRFLPVGFYYSTFFRPKGIWKKWEPVIRNRAGLGKVNEKTHHGYYDKSYAWADVAVVGGGAAGMAAALEAAKAGADVTLIEENPALGGALTYQRFAPDAAEAAARLTSLRDAVEGEDNITVLTAATCTGRFTDNWLSVIQGNRLIKLRANQVVVAAGALEQPLIFHNNDLPGVMMASAAQRLIRHYGVKPGERAVVATANDEGYGAALDLLDAGVAVTALLDLREAIPETPLADAVRAAGVPMHAGATIREAVPGPGKRSIKAVIAAKITGKGECNGPEMWLDADLVCMSVGFTPTHHMLSHGGARLGYDGDAAMFTLREIPDGMHAAGAVNGAFDLDAAIADGAHAGWSAANAAGHAAGQEPAVPADKGMIGRNHPWPIFAHPKHKNFIDFDEDLQVRDILDAIAEGYDHAELLKRFSTVGMGPSQGRHSALNTVRLAADATGQDVVEVGTTTARPPFAAEKFGHMAGRSFETVRHTPMHHRHIELGAQMMPAGLWMRPAYYGARADRERLIQEEAGNVRENVGMIDVSTLGGLEVRGPDAAEFLNRLYTFAYLKQPVGRSRYVLMTDESGVIVDDGVACRFHDNHFYVTATTSGVDGVYRNMLWWNAQWRLDVDVTNVTAAWAGVNIAGPNARAVLEKMDCDIDLSAEAFPYIEARSGALAGIPCRMLRVGFVGELGYEIHVPATMGEALWDKLTEAGAGHGIRPFGVEAQRLLRLEKGHIIVSQDTDGLTHPVEADMAWAISRKKPFFVGGRAIDIQVNRGVERKLVGFTLPADGPLPEECHLTVRGDEITGRVTSAARSNAVGKIVGLAYVAPDQEEPGTKIDIRIDGGRILQGEVAALPFYDPDNARQEL